MNHLDKLWVKPSQFRLGFNTETLKYISWRTYTDTWRLVDRGVEDVYELPLFTALSRYYGEKDAKRLRFEQELLNLPTSNPETITGEWIKRHIELYHNIREEGYKPELRKIPITAQILNDGSLWLMDGTHTVSILKHLKIDAPIETVIHKRKDGWINLKKSLYKMYGKKLLYQPTGHPDLVDWKVDRPCYARWKLIEPHLEDMKGKPVLDIGSNMGYFSFAMAGKGLNVIGVDNHEARVKASNLLKRFHRFPSNNPMFYCTPFEKLLSKTGTYFTVTLMLSLLHHYIRRSPREAWNAVDLISKHSDKLILELGTERFPVKWVPELVLEHSNYTEYKTIYQGTRPMYLYSRRT